MSKIVEHISLNPKMGVKAEHMESRGHDCYRCHGNGWYWKGEFYNLKHERCDLCGGTGKVKAVIDIKWVGDE